MLDTLIDSHCHLDLEPLSADLPAVLERAEANGVAYMLCVAVNLEDYPRIAQLAATYPNLYASVGVHPNSTDCHDPSTDELVELASNPDVVAIGETGLDYYRSQPHLDWQQQRFERHIEAAKLIQKPLIIHMRNATDDTMDTLERLHAEEAGGVMHCFSEDWAAAERALAIGFYISFSGIVTFKNAEMIKQVARKVPIDRMLVETDAPYLAPVPYRGKVNEPSFVRHTAKYIAELRGDTLDNIANATSKNFFRLFATAHS